MNILDEIQSSGWKWRDAYTNLWEAGYDTLYCGVRTGPEGPLGFPDLQAFTERLVNISLMLPFTSD